MTAGEVIYLKDGTPPAISSIDLGIIIPAVVLPVTIIFICCLVLVTGIALVFRRKYSAKKHHTLSGEMSEFEATTSLKSPLQSGKLIVKRHFTFRWLYWIANHYYCDNLKRAQWPHTCFSGSSEFRGIKVWLMIAWNSWVFIWKDRSKAYPYQSNLIM